MQSKLRLAILLAVSLLAYRGCQKRTKRPIGIVPKATSHLFFLSIHAAVRDAARHLGAAVLRNGPREESEFSRQIEIVDSMVAQNVDGLAISATDQ